MSWGKSGDFVHGAFYPTIQPMTSDPNEAYAVSLATEGPLAGWWQVTRDGKPIRKFAPDKRHLAERYCRDPAYRAEIAAAETPLHERGPAR